jgi:hypothetical protein
MAREREKERERARQRTYTNGGREAMDLLNIIKSGRTESLSPHHQRTLINCNYYVGSNDVVR